MRKCFQLRQIFETLESLSASMGAHSWCCTPNDRVPDTAEMSFSFFNSVTSFDPGGFIQQAMGSSE